MLHGLLWLPLLIFFFWITWAGWNEYRKVEAYKEWATQFERAKYDIYAALGQAEETLTWGVPTRQGVIELQTTQFEHVQTIDLLVKGDKTFTDLQGAVQKGSAVLQLTLDNGSRSQIPFTDKELATKWYQFLTQRLEAIA